jgi:hypothetical protein
MILKSPLNEMKALNNFVFVFFPSQTEPAGSIKRKKPERRPGQILMT